MKKKIFIILVSMFEVSSISIQKFIEIGSHFWKREEQAHSHL